MATLVSGHIQREHCTLRTFAVIGYQNPNGFVRLHLLCRSIRSCLYRSRLRAIECNILSRIKITVWVLMCCTNRFNATMEEYAICIDTNFTGLPYDMTAGALRGD